MIFNQENIQPVKELLTDSQKIVITSHQSPDGDAIGSALGLFHFLKAKGHDVVVVMHDPIPSFLNWMNGTQEIVVYQEKKELAIEKVKSSTVFFSLDYNDIRRVGEISSTVEKIDATKIMIDHHQHPKEFADHQFSDTTACSTAQMIYEFITTLDPQYKITPAAADCLYCGIMTDTGSFRFPATTPETHRIVADLIEAGANHSHIHHLVYDSYSAERLRLLGFALSQKMEVLKKYKTAIIHLTSAELKKFWFQRGDTEGLVNYGLSIKDVNVSVLFMEKDGIIKISFRSYGDTHVNEFAANNFEGGGHVNAAGGKSDLSMEDTIKKFKLLLPELIK